MMDEENVELLTQALARDPRFTAAILFGSVAKGTARPGSDIDIAVLYVNATARASAEADVIELLGQLGIIARRDVHLVDLEHADSALRRSIFATGRVLFNRGGSALRDLHVATLLEYFDWAYARQVIDEGHRRKLGIAHGWS